MKNGRPKWTTLVSRPALDRIHAAIAGGEQPRAIFDRFNIQQYAIEFRTFNTYCKVKRRDWEDRQDAPDPAARAATSDTLLLSLLGSIQMSLDAGRKIESGMVNAVTACVQSLKLDLNRNADARAAEKHGLWVADAKAKLKEAVKSKTEGGKTLTRDDVYDLVDSIMRGEDPDKKREVAA